MPTMWGEAASPWMRDMALDIMQLLDTAYPGHPWKVHVYGDDTGGGFQIRHLEFDGAPYGMNEPRAHLFGSASELRARVIYMGGELLERVNLTRGVRNEAERVTRMEGVPERHQPTEHRTDIKHLVLLPKDSELREEARPQVKELLKHGD